MQVTAVLTLAEEGGYVAFDPETGTTTQGGTIASALSASQEAVERYSEDEPVPFAGPPIVTTFIVGEHA